MYSISFDVYFFFEGDAKLFISLKMTLVEDAEGVVCLLVFFSFGIFIKEVEVELF